MGLRMHPLTREEIRYAAIISYTVTYSLLQVLCRDDEVINMLNKNSNCSYFRGLLRQINAEEK